MKRATYVKERISPTSEIKLDRCEMRVVRYVGRFLFRDFKKASVREEFERWHLKTYGEPYVWPTE